MAQLKAFQEMAGALHHVGGGKTVIWLTGYFPVEVNDVKDSINIDSYGIWSSFPVKPASIDYQRTVNLLNEAQISIFPVQLAGSQRTKIGLQQIAQSTSGKVMASSDALEKLISKPKIDPLPIICWHLSQRWPLPA